MGSFNPPNIAPYLTSKINNFSAKPRFPVAVWELPGGGRSGSEGPLSGHGYHLRLPALWVGATLAAAAATALLGDVDAGCLNGRCMALGFIHIMVIHMMEHVAVGWIMGEKLEQPVQRG